MTGNPSAGARSDTADSGSAEYQAMLDTAIEEARRKVESGRVCDAENEKVRIEWIRALACAVNVRRRVATDRDLEELTERIERIEQQ